MLPHLGREPAVSAVLKWVPTKFFPNYFLALVLTAESMYAYGRNHLNAILFAAIFGGPIILAYPLVQLVDTSLDAFLLLNLVQTVAVVGIYLAYLHFFCRNERLLVTFFDYRSWYSAFMRALKILKNGLQPAAISAMEQLSTALITFAIQDPQQLASFQALSFIPNIFYNITASIEPYISGRLVWIMNRFPIQRVKHELKRLLGHSSWIGSIFPLVFFILCMYFKEAFVSFLVSPTAENAEITEIVTNDLVFVALLPLLRSLRGNLYGIIMGFKQSKDPFYHRQNALATGINSVAAFFILLFGAGLDYNYKMGARGYWMSSVFMQLGSTLLQFLLVLQCITHTSKSMSSSQPNLSTSPCRFWQKKHESEDIEMGKPNRLYDSPSLEGHQINPFYDKPLHQAPPKVVRPKYFLEDELAYAKKNASGGEALEYIAEEELDQGLKLT